MQELTITHMVVEDQINMYEGVIKESNVLLKLYNSCLTYQKPTKEELKKISNKLLEVSILKEWCEEQLQLLKNK